MNDHAKQTARRASRRPVTWARGRILLTASLGLWALSTVGCEGSGSPGGGLLGLGSAEREKWTILCLRSEAPGHEAYIRQLAEMLDGVQGLQARKARVVVDPTGSTLYYGEYAKVTSPKTGRLVFSPQYQQDIVQIQRLTINNIPVFRYAKPELINGRPQGERGEWDVANAKGSYTLQISVFYNTEGFDQRREVAEEYVRLLRADGFPAYYHHEPVRSFVYVGDFEGSDVVNTPDGPRFGQRVEQLIARREEEFRYVLENGHRVRRTGPDGQMTVPYSMLVPVPRN